MEKKILQDYVKSYIKENGMSVAHFARCIGCKPNRASNWLKKKNGTTLTVTMTRNTYDFVDGKFHKTMKTIVEKAIEPEAESENEPEIKVASSTERKTFELSDQELDCIAKSINYRFSHAVELEELKLIERIHRQLGYPSDTWVAKLIREEDE